MFIKYVTSTFDKWLPLPCHKLSQISEPVSSKYVTFRTNNFWVLVEVLIRSPYYRMYGILSISQIGATQMVEFMYRCDCVLLPPVLGDTFLLHHIIIHDYDTRHIAYCAVKARKDTQRFHIITIIGQNRICYKTRAYAKHGRPIIYEWSLKKRCIR